MRQATGELEIATPAAGLHEVTSDVVRWVAAQGIATGLLTIFCRHTSASLTIQENADPDVLTDLASALDRLAPRTVRYVHDLEGPDDMPAHIRTMVTDSSLTVPIADGRLALGRWQGIYLVEHRDRPHEREITVNLVGTR